MALRNIQRRLVRYAAWIPRLAVGPGTGETPGVAPFHIQPTAEPTAGESGDVYVDVADGQLYVHNGTDWQAVTYTP